MKRMLDLGCGSNKRSGAIGADITRDSAADVIVNLEHTFPFRDNAFDHIIFNHVIEHLTDIPASMEEIWRISAPTLAWKASRLTFPLPHPIPTQPTAITSAIALSIFWLCRFPNLPANCVGCWVSFSELKLLSIARKWLKNSKKLKSGSHSILSFAGWASNGSQTSTPSSTNPFFVLSFPLETSFFV